MPVFEFSLQERMLYAERIGTVFPAVTRTD